MYWWASRKAFTINKYIFIIFKRKQLYSQKPLRTEMTQSWHFSPSCTNWKLSKHSLRKPTHLKKDPVVNWTSSLMIWNKPKKQWPFKTKILNECRTYYKIKTMRLTSWGKLLTRTKPMELWVYQSFKKNFFGPT